MAVKLGEAVVYLLGDKEGIEKNLKETEKQTEGWAKGLGGKIAGFMGKAVLGSLAVATTAVVGIGTAAFAAGMQMDEAMDTIAIATGATGEALAGLRGDFEAVFTSIPTEAGPAAETISELNRRLGITGPTLQDVSANVLEMSRLLGGDAQNNAALFTRVMGDWGVSNEDAAGTLDMVFKASQLTGAGVESLMQKVVQFGSPLRLMGFTLEDSIALFAKWEKEGVNAELAIGSLRIAAGKFAREGVDLQEGLRATITEIQNMDDASAALALGMEVFGARAGPDMTAAIREGRFAIDELAAALENSEGAILATADATADFPEKLQVLKNTATTALAPIGIAFMDIATTVVERLAPTLTNLVPVIEMVAGVVVGLVDALLAGIGPAGDWSALWEQLTALLGADVVAAIQNVVTWFQAIPAWWASQGQPVFNQIVGFVQENLQPILAGLAAALLTVVVPAFVTWAAGAASAAVATIAALAPVLLPIAAIGAAVGVLVKAWSENWGDIQGKTAVVVGWIQDRIGEFLTLIRAWWAEHGDAIIATVRKLWDTVTAAFQAAISWIQTAVSDVLEVLRAWWERWGDDVMDIVNTFWEGIQLIWKTFTDLIRGIFEAFQLALAGDWAGFGAKLRETAEQFLQNIWDVFKNKFELVKQLVQLVIGNIVELWKSIDWAEVGRSVIEGIKNGITAGIGAIKEAARNAARAALDAAKAFLGIGSPSKEFHGVGLDSGRGFVGGIVATIPAAVAAIDNLGAAVVREAQRVLLPISETLYDRAIPTPDELKRLAGGIKKADSSLPYDGFLGIGGVGPGGSVDPASIGNQVIIPDIGVNPDDWSTTDRLPGESSSTSSSRSYGGGGGGGSWSAREKQDLFDLLAAILEKLTGPITVNYTDQRTGASDPNVSQIAADLEWQMRMGTA